MLKICKLLKMKLTVRHMDTSSEKNLNAKFMTDALVLLMFIITALLFLQYSQEIENEITTVVLNSLNDINSSIAETRTGR